MLAFQYDLGAVPVDSTALARPVPPGRDYLQIDVSRQAFTSFTSRAYASHAYRNQGGGTVLGGVFKTTA